MEYYPRLHRTAHSASVGGSKGEGSSHHHQEMVLNSSVDGRSIYVLSSPPSTSPSPTSSRLNIHSVRVAPPELLGLTPSKKSTRKRANAIPDRSVDKMYEWECVRSPLPQLFANTDECGIEEWDCTSHDIVLDESDSVLVDEETLRVSLWDLVSEHRPSGAPRDTHILHMHGRPLESQKLPPPSPERTRAFTCSRTRTIPPPPAPHTRIRLPLLSFFVSLLSIDDTTLHLIAHSPAHSALFPGPVCPSDAGGTRDPRETHGLNALLEPSGRHGALRDGLAVACDESILPPNPFGFSTSSLVGLLDLVRGVCAGGRAALREVYG
ncbi:hypothetical protein BJV78DRAFT_1248025 [Lactifluus subvellereus]|nr:hypothetical protein BJV78DRAFT_1248025 [Lactifluus subvellereus]